MSQEKFLRPAPFDILRLLDSNHKYEIPIFFPIFTGSDKGAYPSLEALIYRKHKVTHIDDLLDFWESLEELIKADVFPGLSIPKKGDHFLIQEDFIIKDASPMKKLLAGAYLVDGKQFIRKLSKRQFIRFMGRKNPFFLHRAVNMPAELCRFGVDIRSSWITSLSYGAISSIRDTFKYRDMMGFEAFLSAWDHYYSKTPLLTTLQDPLVMVCLCRTYPNPYQSNAE